MPDSARTPDGAATQSDESLARTAALLQRVFPGSGTGEPDYLDWLYRRNPAGPVVEADLDESTARLGHYAVVPLPLCGPGGARSDAALSLNTAVDSAARGGGVFTRLAREAFALARSRGIKQIVGVANANSTPGFLKRLGFSLAGPLPASAHVPVRRRAGRVESLRADGAVLGDGSFWTRLTGLLEPPQTGVAVAWDEPLLKWRLSSPRGPYFAHLHEEAAAISTVHSAGPLRVGVVLKLLPARGASPAAVRELFAAVARCHRAAALVHAGPTGSRLGRGAPIPGRLRPSPLNLIHLDLSKPEPQAPPEAPHFAAFEFLDFDAY